MRPRFHALATLGIITGMIRVLVIALSGLASTPALPASTRPAAVVTAEQCAGDAAFAKLVDAVFALRLADGGSLAELWAGVLTAEGEAGYDSRLRSLEAAEQGLRLRLLQALQLSRSRRTADGAIEVDASVSMEKLDEILRELTARLLPERVAAEAIISRGDRPLTATGRWQGAPPATAGPAGWRHCDGRQLQQVAAAARTDARQHLLTLLGEWRLPDDLDLSEIWSLRPDFRLAVERASESLPPGEPLFGSTGLCRVTTRVRRADVIRLLATAAQSCAEPIDEDVASAVDPQGREVIELEGLAVPPPFTPTARLVEAPEAAGRPDWADRVLETRVTGQAPTQVADTAERLRMARAAAIVEGKREIWLQIERL
ncbi:MAG TPA: hypothetical protein VLM89_02630, partial [Phycisphaerae bacterium]|nr:hypothetical protein [Phycisphaerae bacterium]